MTVQRAHCALLIGRLKMGVNLSTQKAAGGEAGGGTDLCENLADRASLLSPAIGSTKKYTLLHCSK